MHTGGVSCNRGTKRLLREVIHRAAPPPLPLSATAGALNNAITCTILAAAGPQRSRVLAQLCKDERSSALPVWPFLEKVFRERILRRHGP